jgi:hypothetical protein
MRQIPASHPANQGRQKQANFHTVCYLWCGGPARLCGGSTQAVLAKDPINKVK